MKKQIVFVLSTNYAGSHFLALQLASNSQCASVGEFLGFRREKSRRRKVCSICDDDETCPLFKGLSNERLPQLFDDVFANLRQMDPGVRTVIDNSKKIRWAKLHLHLGERYDLRFIHLVRDPRALVRRWFKCYTEPGMKEKVRRIMARRCRRQFLSIRLGSFENAFVHKWAYQNQRILDFIRRHGLDSRLVTYHDLAKDPDTVLAKLMTWLGIPYEPSQKYYWKFTHHGSWKTDYMKMPDDKRFFDLRWKRDLSIEVQRFITQHPAIPPVLEQTGLRLTDEGLTTGKVRREKQHASPE